MVKHALLIGINYYNSDNQLAGCINDIMDMHKYLAARGFTKFTVLKDHPEDANHTYPDCPTRANILAAMKKCVAAARAGDTLVVHYSGHGSQLAIARRLAKIGAGHSTGGQSHKDVNEADGLDECICPVDFDWSAPDDNFIRDDTLQTVLVAAATPTTKLRIFFDSCHSGSALDLPYRWIAGDKYSNESAVALDRDVVFLSGCKDSETSADAAFHGRPNGALTWALLSSLNAIHSAAASGGSVGSWEALCLHVHKLLAGYSQSPQLSAENKTKLTQQVDI